MKLSDYVIRFLEEQGIEHVFGLTGTAVVRLFDSAARNCKIQTVFCHHEQAAALAAVSYARTRNSLGATLVTTGPGGTNAITGVVAAWQDSIPCFFISGQQRYAHTSHGKPVRQLAAQELDIVSIVKSTTKYAAMVQSPHDIRYHMEKARYLAVSGRPGPVWIDIPTDFQWSDIEPITMRGFSPPDVQYEPLDADVDRTVAMLVEAKRPLLLAGYGIRLAHAEEAFKQLVERLELPFVATWTASDMVPTSHPLHGGRVGYYGQRGANLAVQNCDLLIVIGSHLSVSLTGTLTQAFAREAKIVAVAIDPEALAHQTVRIDIPIVADAHLFIDRFVSKAASKTRATEKFWLERFTKYRTYKGCRQKTERNTR
jgi:acetolactate synthase I/II/III large subunit